MNHTAPPLPLFRLSDTMRLAHPDGGPRCAEDELLRELLHLRDARVVELGCGKAEQTLRLARAHPRASFIAFEVDPIQHELNLASAATPNVEFRYGGAQTIAIDDATIDVVLMFKSLHHVPVDRLDQALREIRRILKPGGLAYISEPVFAGELNEINRIFHDEECVRQAAFDALCRAVAAGVLELVTERFIRITRTFADFADYERKVIGATYNDNRLTAAQYDEVRRKFEAHLTPEGARFDAPMRIDLLRKPAGGA